MRIKTIGGIWGDGRLKFHSKDQKLQKQEHYPDSSFVDCPVKDEDDKKIDGHPVWGLAIYSKYRPEN